MLRARVLFTAIAVPLGIIVIFVGNWLFALVVSLILARGVWEYAIVFERGGNRPARSLMVISIFILVAARFSLSFSADSWLLTLFVLLAMTVHLVSYERGRTKAATDFTTTLSGFFYIGLLGSYFISLRSLPHGEWWLLFSLFAVWLTDSGAFFLGTAYGRHKMTPRLSPHKSWEGYVGGVLVGTLVTPLFLFVFLRLGLPNDPAFSFLNVAILSFAIGTLTTLGDLGESMLKRQMKVKDASHLIPGHGGVLDRIDSWLWALPIGYYVVSLVFLQIPN